ncbi:hypothetical protein BO70DRAFT_372874 [Aspergillus heteromorphus CBS 117.55]|uniref:FHA domain-containing protein n=1 Tax=Aspergillus heteromorphus CBS 117.55 TaxID=1448321 RepID=A0A317VMJ3_9EURO|nr:uncharacterized protein BO70DRAFT_372874 [Aspergillus heteromorphus CBS 117.55]PWY75135.1 hypothetical protein BO70DRAFT_372874 [Aspergillus heteromorphus CBS 117.55]
MPVSQAVVNLRPLGLQDDPPYRCLKFTPEKPHTNIGRASKRESKGLVPNKANGLFDSRVMSRHHARLGVCFDKKVVYIRDGDSMHGTRVNDKKIPTEEDTVIQDGDVVTFGSTVIRGADTFPPLQVRCEIEWPLPAYVPRERSSLSFVNTIDRPRPMPATNTFCVPDDYESDVKQDALPVSCGTDSVSENGNSILCSDSDGHSVMEVSSPLTSPINRDDTKSQMITLDLTAGEESPDLNGSKESPINLDTENPEQPLVTPRMTPPSAMDILEGPNDTIHYHAPEEDAVSVLDSSDEEDSNWEEENDQAGSEEDWDSQSSFSSDAEQSFEGDDSGASNSPRVLGIRDLLVSDASLALGETDSRLDSDNEASHSDGEDRYDSLGQNLKYGDDLPALRNISPVLNPQAARHGMASIAAPLLLNPLRPILSLQNRGDLDHSVSHNTFITPMEWWNPRTAANAAYPMPLHTPPSPQVPYNDGPFVNGGPLLLDESANFFRVNPDLTAAGNIAAGEKRNDTPLNSEDSAQKEAAITPEQQSFPSLSLAQELRPECDPVAVKENRPPKRKAGELDSLLSEPITAARTALPSGESSYEETCFPDAQPDVPMDKLESPSQLTEMGAADEHMEVDSPSLDAGDTERQSKRAKTSSAGNFASHAATAALGVAIGAFGTIAALASLPPDYFQ